MYQTSDWIKALSRLSKFTVQGELTWQATNMDEDDYLEPADKVGRAFVADHKHRRYRVFEVTRKIYTDEDEYYWANEYYLDIFERLSPHHYNFITRSPDLPAASDLFRTVERKYAHTKGALNDLLDGEDDSSDP